MSFLQEFALKQNINARERAILASNPAVAQGWTIASGYARMVSNAFAYTTDDLSDSLYRGKADALRHCVWSALLAHQVGEVYAKKLTDAHEDVDPPADHNARIDREMDLHNNAVGRRLGVFHNSQRSVITQSMTAFFLFGLCKNALESGQLRVIDRSRTPWMLVPSDAHNVA